MKKNIENALYHCGRDRVFSREQPDPGVAIRWDDQRITSPGGMESYLVRKDSDINVAGEQAAKFFAARIRERAKELNEWAERIESALRGAP